MPGDIDQLENLPSAYGRSPGALADVYVETGPGDLDGEDGRPSLDRLAVANDAEERADRAAARRAHTSDGRRGGWYAAIGQKRPCRPVLEVGQDPFGLDHRWKPVGHRPGAGLRDQALRVRRSVNLTSEAHGAQSPSSAKAEGHPGQPDPDGLEVERRRNLTGVSHGLHGRPVASMPMRETFSRRQEGGQALQSTISTSSLSDIMGLVGFSEVARSSSTNSFRGLWGLVYGTHCSTPCC